MKINNNYLYHYRKDYLERVKMENDYHNVVSS